MTKQEQIKQAEAEVISFQNTIKSLQERIDYKQSCLDGLHGKGRVQEIKLEYFDRTVVIPTDQPELYENVITELEKSIKQQINIFKESGDKEKVRLEEKEIELTKLKQGWMTTLIESFTGKDKELYDSHVKKEADRLIKNV
jgi:hypothetical protein